MNEKKININDAFQVWWFVAWRTGLSIFIVDLILGYLSMNASESILGLMQWISIAVAIVIGAFFMSKAINKDYKGFRLSAVSSQE